MKLSELFSINYGQKRFHSKENLTKGKTLLISSQGEDNGCYGFFDIVTKYNPPFISVPSTGTIGQAFVQTIPCCVDDNCLVIIPNRDYSLEYLFYISLAIRNQKWRFMYGRQLTPERVGRINVIDPSDFKTDIDFNDITRRLTPLKKEVKSLEYKGDKRDFKISELFKVESGEYHSINSLKEGKIPLISCKTADNGISGFYNIPDTKTHKYCITVAYDGKPLTTMFHDYKFSAYDNVGVLTPLFNMKKTTLIFITLILNIERWRYSYGRKCYKQKLETFSIKLPKKKDKIDEDYIERIMQNRDIFNYFKH